ncbi:G-type lectin S-receptor-like serine/threonine-protein kinase SD2-5 [Platanthera guangdongensis]|uniref:Receptor-like serine/threonine-protein kinase n=1 Tax=Platanthera guangdongensis TaxID=2320717 RepID=A0ABR2MAJ0_9ASPA
MTNPTPVLHLLFTAAAVAVFLLPIISATTFDHPTANLSTSWTIGPSLTRNITYPDGSTILALLVRGFFGPSFAFGFFCSSPCSSFLLSIYIVYTNSGSLITNLNSAPPQLIWSANRQRPVRLNATLLFSPSGDLILRDADGSLVWSTNTSGEGAASLTLLNSGNLVIMDNKSNHFWASFDHPTDSLLVGQSLKQGQSLTSNSSTNSTQGLFFITVDSNGLRAFIESNPPQIYYAKPNASSSAKPQNRSAYATFQNGSLDIFMSSTHPNLPDYSISLPTSPSTQYIRLDSNGHLGLYAWNEGWSFAQQVFDEFPDDCAYPTVCGHYGICSNGQCSCPQLKNGNSDYFRPVDPLKINSGCNPVASISCRSNESIELLAVDEVAYFNYIDQSSSVMRTTDENSCKEACLRNCSCKAALFRYNDDLTTGSCYLPSEIFSLMINNPQNSHYNSSAFLKVQTVSAPTPDSSISTGSSSSSGSQKMGIIIGVISVFVFAAMVLLVLIFVVRRRRRRRAREEDEDQFGEIPELQARFSHDELVMATENFKNKLGEGGFGSVYVGTLKNGTKVAVKRLNGVGRAKTEFVAEMKTLVAIHHINLVKLIGFCSEGDHRLLVFEFMPNGSLDKWIFNRTHNASLDWQTKCRIISNIAKGLSYLHEGCKQRIIHLDIKPQNILLDENFNAKVADFGLAKLVDRDQDQVMTRMRGTVGYLAPEWLTSVISEKADVFSFGVVVMEIVCGRKNLDNSLKGEVHLVSLLQEKIGEGRITDMIEGRENYEQWEEDEAAAMLKLAAWCLQTDSGRRPSMAVVVKVLEGGLNVETNVNHNFFTAATLGKNDAACWNDSNSAKPTASLLSGPR